VVLGEVDRVHHHSRGAEAALQAVMLLERRLHRVQGAVRLRHALDGQYVGALGLHRQHRTRLHGFAVHLHRASAALGGVAADVSAGEAKLLANERHQKGSRFDLGRNGLSVDLHGYFHCHVASFGIGSCVPRNRHAGARVGPMPAFGA
jgi:hypothetical protein